MGWRPVECQPHGPSTTSHMYGMLMGASLRPTNKPARMSTSVCLPCMYWRHINIRLTTICTRRGGSWPLKDKSSCDSSSPQDQKLPTPPRSLWEKVVEKADRQQTKTHQTASMEISHSSSMSWEDQVQEEEQQR